jgi:hypothetical protein
MKKGMKNGLPEKTDELFGRVAAILEQARGNVVRAVNTKLFTRFTRIAFPRFARSNLAF